MNTSSLGQYEALLKAVRSEDLDATEKFIRDYPGGETVAFHLATMLGHFHIVERLISEDDIKLKSDLLITALHCAAFNTNNKKAIEDFVDKNKKLVSIPDESGWLPVTLALDYGHTEMARYLYYVTPFDELLRQNRKNGAKVLIKCFHSKMFGKTC